MNRGAAPPGPSAPELVVQLSTGQLRALVAEAVAEVLAEHEPPQLPSLLTTDQLADALQVSRSTVYAMRDRGMPVVMVLESPRFRLTEVLAWLDNDSAGLERDAETPMQKPEPPNAEAAVLPLRAAGKRKPVELNTHGRRGGRG